MHAKTGFDTPDFVTMHAKSGSDTPDFVTVHAKAGFDTPDFVTVHAKSGFDTPDFVAVHDKCVFYTPDFVTVLTKSGFDTPDFVTVRATHATLQSLLAAPVSATRVIPQQEQTIQVITLPASSNLITTSQPDGAGQVWQVVPNIGNPEIATIIAVADPSELIQATKTDIGGESLQCSGSWMFMFGSVAVVGCLCLAVT